MMNFRGILLTDSEQFAEKVIISLKSQNIELTLDAAKSEQDCLGMLESQAFDLLIVYHHPPAIDALSVVRTVASRHFVVEILVIAPVGHEKILNQSVLEGAFAYFIDTFDCYEVIPQFINRMISSLGIYKGWENEPVLQGARIAHGGRDVSPAGDLFPFAYEEKLKILDRLISFVAHEMKNPFTTINNALYFLQKKVPDQADPIFKKYIQIIEDELASSNRFLSTLHFITRKTAVNLSLSNVNEILKETVQQIPIPKKIKVVFQLDSHITSGLIDPEQIQIAFSQVVRNAIQAMPEGGDLTVRTVRTEKMVEVHIIDQGVGIEQDHLPHIAEVFFTTKSRNIGVGLPIAKSIIEAHNGLILFDSAPGQGTKCTILLPQL